MTAFFFAFFSFLAQAYIPEWSLISSRTADQHGRGVYQIEQDVTFRREAEAYTVKETWLVANEGSLRVTLEGRGALKGLVQGTILFDGTTRTLSDGALLKNQRTGEDWLEPLFHFRTGKYLRTRMVQLRILPAETLNDRPPLKSSGDPDYQAPSFIRLSRTGGSIDWAIGQQPKSSSAPALWIEQDQFVLRKFKGANQTVVRADDYAKYDDGLWFPKSRSYEFGGFIVTTQTLSVKSVGRLAPADNRFKSSSLNATKDALKLPDVDGLREFYLRFR